MFGKGRDVTSSDETKPERIGRFKWGVAALLSLLAAIVVGCTDDSPSVTSLPSITTTRAASQTTVTTPTTRPPTTTTITSPVAPEEQEYVRELLRFERRALELIERVEQINEEWDARTTGLSVTDQALVEAVADAQQLKADFDQIRRPNLDPFVTHTKVGSAVSRIHAEIESMLQGLRSPDAGEARHEALAGALETRTEIGAGINRAAADVGYSEPPNRNPITTTTTRPSATTTRTTRRVTTTRRITTTTVDLEAIAEKCFSAWDGNHNGFERQIRERLNDPGSMRTYGTYWFSNEDVSDGSMTIQMDYGARNQLGGMVRTKAWGEMDVKTCEVTVIDYGS